MLDRQNYVKKMQDCFHPIGATIDPAFSFDQHNEKIRQKMGGCQYILDKDPLQKAVLISNPRAPLPYGLPKIHKVGSHAPRGLVYFFSHLQIRQVSLYFGSKRQLVSAPSIFKKLG